MAKKQTVSSRRINSSEIANKDLPAIDSGPKSRSAKGTAGAKTTAASAPLGGKRGLAIDEIGAVAGEVWHTLSDSGSLTPAALKKKVDAPGDLVLAAVGWLAREGKLEFTTAGRSVKVSLR